MDSLLIFWEGKEAQEGRIKEGVSLGRAEQVPLIGLGALLVKEGQFQGKLPSKSFFHWGFLDYPY